MVNSNIQGQYVKFTLELFAPYLPLKWVYLQYRIHHRSLALIYPAQYMFSKEPNHEVSMVFRLLSVYFIGKTRNVNREQTSKKDGIQTAICDFFAEKGSPKRFSSCYHEHNFIIACSKKWQETWLKVYTKKSKIWSLNGKIARSSPQGRDTTTESN